MKSYLAAIGLIASSCLAAPAFAQDAPAKSPFAGASIGAVVGYDSVRLSVDGDSGSDEGVIYGLTAGYDVEVGNGAIVGVEAEINDSSVSESATDLIFAGDSMKISAGRDLYAGVRAGVAVSPQVLLYAKAGYANARASISYDDGAGFSFSDSDNMGGYRLGAGVEYAASKFFGRVEYRYSDYGEYKTGGIATGVELSRHQGALVLGVRF